MVAQKRGRGAKGQAMKTRAAPPVEEAPVEQPELNEEAMESSEGNGEAADQQELSEDALLEGDVEGEETQPEGAEGENAEGTAPVEEKVESGKILIENLPSSYLFDYQDKLKEIFSKYGEIVSVRRGPIIVTELTTTPTLSAIVEFQNKESLEKAIEVNGNLVEGNRVSVAVESRADTAILVGVPHEASLDYVRRLFCECGEIHQIQEFSKAKYKILRVTFQAKESVEKALKLDRELRINGFLVTVTKYRDEEEQKAHSANNKRPHPGSHNRNNGGSAGNNSSRLNYRGRGTFNVRGNFRGGRGRGFAGGRGGSFPRGGFSPAINSYMPPAAYMAPRPGGFMSDGQRPNKRVRQM